MEVELGRAMHFQFQPQMVYQARCRPMYFKTNSIKAATDSKTNKEQVDVPEEEDLLDLMGIRKQWMYSNQDVVIFTSPCAFHGYTISCHEGDLMYLWKNRLLQTDFPPVKC